MSELAQGHDGASITDTTFNGSARLEIELTEEQIDELPDSMSADEFAGNVAESRVKEEWGFEVRRRETIVQVSDEWRGDSKTVFDAVVFVG